VLLAGESEIGGECMFTGCVPPHDSCGPFFIGHLSHGLVFGLVACPLPAAPRHRHLTAGATRGPAVLITRNGWRRAGLESIAGLPQPARAGVAGRGERHGRQSVAGP
jgi:hypothetical protein